MSQTAKQKYEQFINDWKKHLDQNMIYDPISPGGTKVILDTAGTDEPERILEKTLTTPVIAQSVEKTSDIEESEEDSEEDITDLSQADSNFSEEEPTDESEEEPTDESEEEPTDESEQELTGESEEEPTDEFEEELTDEFEEELTGESDDEGEFTPSKQNMLDEFLTIVNKLSEEQNIAGLEMGRLLAKADKIHFFENPSRLHARISQFVSSYVALPSLKVEKEVGCQLEASLKDLVSFTRRYNLDLRQGGSSRVAGNPCDPEEQVDEEIDLNDCDLKPLPKSKFQNISFDSIVGQDQAKANITTDFIYPFIYSGLFPEISKGILLYGPPGTGKTLLAKATVNELKNSAFFAPLPADLKSRWEGGTEERISNLFKCASQFVKGCPQYDLSIVFVDEVEGIAGASDEPSMKRTLNSMLQGMDGITERKDVAMIAATNFPWQLAGSALRRWSSLIFVDLPDEDARKAMVERQIRYHYSWPHDRSRQLSSDEEKAKDLKRVLYQIAYGKHIVDKYKSRIGRTDKGKLRYINEGTTYKEQSNDTITMETIGDLAKVTGPTEAGIKMIADINKGTLDTSASAIVYDEQPTMFGYSGSDIVKLIDIAHKNASMRALPTNQTTKRYYIPVTVEDASGAEAAMKLPTYYLFCPFDPFECVHPRIFRKAKGLSFQTPISYEDIAQPDYDKIITFNLRGEDFMKALKEYPPSTKNSDYICLLQYSLRQRASC